jgi:hypothetical protein
MFFVGWFCRWELLSRGLFQPTASVGQDKMIEILFR